jgi:hypothetical protein
MYMSILMSIAYSKFPILECFTTKMANLIQQCTNDVLWMETMFFVYLTPKIPSIFLTNFCSF